MRHERGTALVVGLILLTVVTMLGLAGADTAHVERQLARNEQFRENAAAAASAGVEIAINRIVSTTDIETSANFNGMLPGTQGRYETRTRFMGYETGLPQSTATNGGAANLEAAHIEIVSNGYAGVSAIDIQRAIVMRVVMAPTTVPAADCEPVVPATHCFLPDDLVRLSWQRLPRP